MLTPIPLLNRCGGPVYRVCRSPFNCRTFFFRPSVLFVRSFVCLSRACFLCSLLYVFLFHVLVFLVCLVSCLVVVWFGLLAFVFAICLLFVSVFLFFCFFVFLYWCAFSRRRPCIPRWRSWTWPARPARTSSCPCRPRKAVCSAPLARRTRQSTALSTSTADWWGPHLYWRVLKKKKKIHPPAYGSVTKLLEVIIGFAHVCTCKKVSLNLKYST